VILQAHPTLYTIDGMRGVARPLGLYADQLGVDIHVVLADGAPLRVVCGPHEPGARSVYVLDGARAGTWLDEPREPLSGRCLSLTW
jgi:hypothetical protein